MSPPLLPIKRRHTERIETRTELALPQELSEAVATLTGQMLEMKRDIADLKQALGDFYRSTDSKAA